MLLIALSSFAGALSAQTGDSATRQDTVALSEVTISQRMVRHEGGKTIVNVVGLRKGKTNLVDLLAQVPGLRVEDNSVSILGKGGLKVMFNGRLKNIPQSELYNILKSRPASNVTQVEIQKEAGAKYDASGNYGVLNIVTERTVDYVGGDVADEVAYGKKWGNAWRTNWNLCLGKTEAGLNFGWEIAEDDYKESNMAYFPSLSRSSTTRSTPRKNNYNVSGMLDYHIDSLSLVGVEVSYISSYKKNHGVNALQTYALDGGLMSEGSADSRTRTPRENFNASLYIDRKWGKDNKISLMTDFFAYDYSNHYAYGARTGQTDGSVAEDFFVNDGSSQLRGISSMLDYEGKLPWGITVSTGAQVSLTRTKNATSYELTTLPLQDDRFKYEENVYAGYLLFSKKVGRWDFDLGGRYEQTWTRATPPQAAAETKTYGRFFPDVRASFSFEGGSSLALSVNSGIDRPGIRLINPFVHYINNYNIAMGNPTLRPSHWWNVRLSHTLAFKGGELMTDLLYYRDSGVFDQTTRMDATENVSVSQWNNAANTRTLGVEMIAYYYGLSWMKGQAGFFLSHDKSSPRLDIHTEEVSHFVQTYFTHLRFLFDKRQTWTGFLDASYHNGEKTAVGKIDGMVNMQCGVGYSCLANRLNLKLVLANILAKNTSGMSRSNDGMYMTFDNKYRSLSVRVGVSYSFGRDIRKRGHRHSNGDIKARFD